MRPALRNLFRAIGLLLAGTMVGVFALYFWLETVGGDRWLAQALSETLSSTDQKVTLERLSGDLPFHPRLGRLAVSDRQGPWLTIQNVSLDISLSELLHGRMRIDRLSAASVEIARPPRASSPASAPSIPSFTIPHLPVAIAVTQLGLPHISLGAPFLGQAMLVSIDADGRLASGRALLDAEINRLDGIGGHAAMAIDYDVAANQRLNLSLNAHEPSGLLVQALDPVAGRLPLTIMLSGQGPISAWRGALIARAGDQTTIRASIGSDEDHGAIVLAANGTAQVLPLLPKDMRPIIGKELAFALRTRVSGLGSIKIETMSLAATAGNLALVGDLNENAKTLDLDSMGTLSLSAFSDLLGTQLGGRSTLQAHITGPFGDPQGSLNLSTQGLEVGGFHVSESQAKILATSKDGRIYQISSNGFFDQLNIERANFPPALARRLQWSCDLGAGGQAGIIDLRHAAIDDSGFHLSAIGHSGTDGARATIALKIDDLGSFNSLFGRQVNGTAGLTGLIQWAPHGTIDGHFLGQTNSLRLNTTLGDALLGGTIDFGATLRRTADGTIIVSQIRATNKELQLDANGRLGAGTDRFQTSGTLVVNHLATLSSSLGVPVSGTARITATASGEPGAPVIDASLIANGAAIGATKFDSLNATATTKNFMRSGLDLHVAMKTGTLSESFNATLVRQINTIALHDLAFDGTGGHGGGALAIDTRTNLVSGEITASADDLDRWSGLLGRPMSGTGNFTALLDPRDEQTLDVSAHAVDFAFGGPAPLFTAGKIGLTARLTQLRRKPRGDVSANVSNIRWDSLTLAKGRIEASSSDGKMIAFTLGTAGKFHEPVEIDARGGVELGGNSTILRIAKLDGVLGSQPVHLRRSLTVTKQNERLSVSRFDVALGDGSLTANGDADPVTGHLIVTAERLDLAALGHLLGQEDISGLGQFSATLNGPWRQPVGRMAISIPNLRLAAIDAPDLPSLNTSLTLALRDQKLAINGRIGTLRQEALTIDGVIPIAITPIGDHFFSTGGALHLAVKGDGRLEDMASLLPLGEDQIGGAFDIDLSVDGSLASPRASGSFAISDGDYENLSIGIGLHHLELLLAGNQSNLELRRFGANDGGDGTISGSGRVALGAPGLPALNLSLAFHRFALTRLDEATVLASGNAQILGDLIRPKVIAQLAIDRADIQIPDKLPTQIPTVAFLRINSRHPLVDKPPPSVPSVIASLHINVSAPGGIFISGQGLSSEWRADVLATGTSAKPNIVGQIVAVRGTYAVLGKTFTLQHGTIGFTGGVDPSLDILAQRVASDITATVAIKGTASSPGLTLASTPQLPQDEILSRVLFDTSVGQISPVQGLELAQTVAAFSGNAPDVMSKVRNAIGLDQLTIDSDTTTTTSKGVLSGATLNGGKYIAPGVFVGVEKGLTPTATKGQVQITVTPHISVDGAIGAGSASSNLGLIYQLDY